jgi:hypothetical protein
MPYNKPKYGKGVPKGYTHNWAYKGHWKETKRAPGKWTGTFTATKKTKSGGGGPKPGFKILWKLNGTQQATKTSRGTYQTRFKFKKRKIKAGYY